jgi:thiosulfate/3-mercaptopyruvate sulfurtransferase
MRDQVAGAVHLHDQRQHLATVSSATVRRICISTIFVSRPEQLCVTRHYSYVSVRNAEENAMSDTARSTKLISAAELLAELSDGGSDLVVLDVRQSLSTSSDHADLEAYLSGHIPGALFVDLDTDLAGVSTGANGRRPLPGSEEFEKSVRRWGIDVSTPVVVYGATRSPAPARAWWLLQWAGVESVRLLDGGLDAWISHGGQLRSGEPELGAESDFSIRPGRLPVVEVADVPAFADRALLLDARPAAKFSHPTDESAGHIPGAKSAPVSESFDSAGYFRDSDELREHFARLGIGPSTEPAAYCGSGVSAALEVFALNLLGVRAQLYVGSASEWTADPSRPFER